MEKKPKKSLSLKKLGQKKLNFASRGSQDDPAHTISAAQSRAVAEPMGGEAEESSSVATSSSSSSTSSTVWLSGLCNLGNTCYANSILQVLRFCPHLSGRVLLLSDLLHQRALDTAKEEPMEVDLQASGDAGEDYNQDREWQDNDGALMVQLSKLWQRMAEKEKKASVKSSILSATKPQNLLSALREENEIFNNKMQQDAQEMLRFLLTNLHEAVQSGLSSLPNQPQDLRLPETAAGRRTRTSTARGPLATGGPRKRKLSLQRLHTSRKIPKTQCGKKSVKKVTDYFSSNKKAAKPVEPSCSEVILLNESEELKEKVNTQDELDFVKGIFEGELVSQTHCYECDGCTQRTEAFLDISLAVSTDSLPGFPGSSTSEAHSSIKTRTSSVGPFSLSWALSQFCLRETLGGDNKYKCEQCGHLVEAEKTVFFHRLPRIMTLHLNRFSTHATYSFHHGAGLSVNKIAGNIAIPLTLSFVSWCTQDCPHREELYQLFAVVFHTGSSCSSGHYTTCVRARECRRVSPALSQWLKTDTEWVEFDDEVVELLSEQEVVTKLSPLTPSTAYILFYTVS